RAGEEILSVFPARGLAGVHAAGAEIPLGDPRPCNELVSNMLSQELSSIQDRAREGGLSPREYAERPLAEITGVAERKAPEFEAIQRVAERVGEAVVAREVPNYQVQSGTAEQLGRAKDKLVNKTFDNALSALF